MGDASYTPGKKIQALGQWHTEDMQGDEHPFANARTLGKDRRE
jgi:hypothetical protein